ncbi:chemotaxis protein CheW [Limnofasciculus baicalensis]|uniref:Chemotaxis protein CheW n=1 Tax=Limnofasciculus baicalensis BBK-W-15 TaxID=2699891 RepID=A0AAE3GX76_9CYAN|nr:chemotaxis protein CheW [Limnofasciculus baicalensis]MCP2732371.1 chemotaxis protein CheW [Limnofasciculus baicalensis BBK-W-15]
MPNTTNKTNALALRPNKPQKTKNQGDTYLKFKLNQQTPALLAMSQAQEVILLPQNRLTSMPNMPPFVLGLMNRRSRAIWVINLAQMLGLNETLATVQQYNVIIIRNGSISLGLVVQTVEGVIRLSQEQIQSAQGQISSALVPYLRGCTLLETEILLVLDAAGIIRNLQ